MARKRKSIPKGRSKPRQDKITDLFWSMGRDPKEEARDPKPKSWHEWSNMPRMAFFKWRGHVFHHGDDAQVYSETTSDSDEPRNKWIAHIIGIRWRPGTRNIWVHVKWYHSQEDLAAEFSGIRLGEEESLHLPANERIYSDREEILSYGCFQKVVNVVEWHEEGSAKSISPNTLFTRFRIGWYASKNSSVPYWEVGPGDHTCVPECYAIYHPFLPPELFNLSRAALEVWERYPVARPSGVALRADTMHFCSRHTCRRWFHRSCLTLVHEQRGI